MPVPVQIRIPRLYSGEVLEMPANCDACVSQAYYVMVESLWEAAHLKLARPQRLRRVVDETACEVACAK